MSDIIDLVSLFRAIKKNPIVFVTLIVVLSVGIYNLFDLVILPGKDKEIESREMGQSGVDIKLYAKAKEMFPFSVECRNRERWDIPAWIKQIKSIQNEGTDWLLVISKNRYTPVIIMDANAFFDLYEQLIQEIWDD